MPRPSKQFLEFGRQLSSDVESENEEGKVFWEEELTEKHVVEEKEEEKEEMEEERDYHAELMGTFRRNGEEDKTEKKVKKNKKQKKKQLLITDEEIEEQEETIQTPFTIHNNRDIPKAIKQNFKQQTTQQITNEAKLEITMKSETHYKITQTLPPSIKLRYQTENIETMMNAQPIAKTLTHVLQQYTDCIITCRTTKNAPQIQLACALHILNHAYTIRDKVLRNNTAIANSTKKIAEQREKAKKDAEDKKNPSKRKREDNTEAVANEENITDIADQGFTRPHTLILLPTRCEAYTIIQSLLQIQGGTPNQTLHQLERFEEEYGPAPPIPRTTDHYFQGNTNDDFILGVKVTRKVLRLFSRREDSDILIASPLSIRVALEGAAKGGTAVPSWLSSISLFIADPMEHLFQQNPTHIDYLMEQLCRLPQHPPSTTDFSRVRPSILEGFAKHLVQKVWISSVMFPELRRWSRSINVSGITTVQKKKTKSGSGIIGKMPNGIYSFENFAVEKLENRDEDRFQYFEEKVISYADQAPADN